MCYLDSALYLGCQRLKRVGRPAHIVFARE